MTGDPTSGLSTFAGLRVVEMGVWVAAPSAAALLADWGADVIKVEAPAGDPMRQVFGSLGIDSDMPNPAFSLDNRGQAERRAQPAGSRRPPAPRGSAGHGRRLHHQPAAGLPRRAGPRARGHRRPPPPPRVLQHQRLRPAGRGAEPSHLRHRGLLGPFRAVHADGRPPGEPAQRPRRDRRPHHRSGRAGRPVGGGDRAARNGPGAGRRGLAPADRHLRARVGPRAADDPREGGPGRVEGAEPGAADEPVPRRRRHAGSSSPASRRDATSAPSAAPSAIPSCWRTRASPMPHPSAGTGPRSSPSWTRSSPSEPLADWAERFDEEGVWWAPAQTPAEVVVDPQLLANDGIVEIDGGGTGSVQRSVNGPVSFSGVAGRRCGSGARARPAHRGGARRSGRPAGRPAETRPSRADSRARASSPRAMTSLWISLVPSPMTMRGASR